MSATDAVPVPEAPSGSSMRRDLARIALFVSLGWLGTNVGLNVSVLPLKFLLKDELRLNEAGVAGFFALSQFTNYIKPLAGVLTDTFPLFGTRRRWYLIFSLLATGLLFLALGCVPHTYAWLILTYGLLYLFVVFTSTALGGVMVEAGNRHRAGGRMTAQRIAMFRLGTLFGMPLGAYLAAVPFLVAMGVSGLFHLALVPLFWIALREPQIARTDLRVWSSAGRSMQGLLQNRPLLCAAGMIFLIAASPGFQTPLFFYQTNVLHFSKRFLGQLLFIEAAAGLGCAMLYHYTCRRWQLRRLVVVSILVHALGTLFYLQYNSAANAIWIMAIAGATLAFGQLTVYDLAARATPKGSEALGYSVMMSVWNLTNALSDWSGATLFQRLHLSFATLIWINAITTLLAILVTPFLPAVLMQQRDGVPGGDPIQPKR